MPTYWVIPRLYNSLSKWRPMTDREDVQYDGVLSLIPDVFFSFFHQCFGIYDDELLLSRAVSSFKFSPMLLIFQAGFSIKALYQQQKKLS